MLNEIFKGMDNAAEQIDNNFKGIKDYVIEQGENYTKWNSGKLEQWRTDAITRDNKTVAFPTPFVNTNYQVLAQLDSVQEFDRSIAIQRSSNRMFTVHIYNAPTSVAVHWHAIGSWK